MKSLDKYIKISHDVNYINTDIIRKKFEYIIYDETADILEEKVSNILEYSTAENGKKLVNILTSMNERKEKLLLENIITEMSEINSEILDIKMVILGGLHHILTTSEDYEKYYIWIEDFDVTEGHLAILFMDNKIPLYFDMDRKKKE
jgi:hypothetical protein